MRQKILRNGELKKKICLSPDLQDELFSFSAVKQNFSIYFSVNVLLILFLRQEKYKQNITNGCIFRSK